MEYNNPGTVVSTGWLAEHLDDPELRVLDGSWYLPQSGRDAIAEYQTAHVRGARFFDIDEISDTSVDLPHMAPRPEYFCTKMSEIGIGDGHQVVIYDGAGLFSAARVWWLFRLMGKFDVSVLDGGFPKWKKENRPVENSHPELGDARLTTTLQSRLVSGVHEVVGASKKGSAQILDARPAQRFRGDQPEPRPGLRSGHIPGSLNIPFSSFLNADGTLKKPSALRSAVESGGVDMDRAIITTCGSGVTAAIASLALEVIGHRQHSLYDGSWSEWGSRSDLEIAKG